MLGSVGVNFNIFFHMILRHNFEGKLQVFTAMDEEISIINITPCLNIKGIESIVLTSKAIVIQAYGMGNIPSNNAQLLQTLKKGIDNDKVIVIKT